MKKKKNFYGNCYWYINTYKSLGSEWLEKSIESLNPKIGYILVNLSANAGYYERDVYKKHLNTYNPTYYVGDLNASKLFDSKVNSFKNFNYIDGDNDATSFNISIVPNKADILIDCKGALWHTIHDKKSGKKQLIQLLQNYSNLLNDSGVLLIDYYKISYFKHLFDNLKWSFKRYRKKPAILDCFGEFSTYLYLSKLYGEETVKKIFEPSDIKKEKLDLPLSEIMGTAYITQNNLDSLIKITLNIPRRKFIMIKYLM